MRRKPDATQDPREAKSNVAEFIHDELEADEYASEDTYDEEKLWLMRCRLGMLRARGRRRRKLHGQTQ